MIELSLPANFSDSSHLPFIAKLSRIDGHQTATLVGEIGDELMFQFQDLTISIVQPVGEDIIGDIVFVEPAYNRVSRWIRERSDHNTLLVTERCDQLCIMCSQPPKKSHIDMFTFMEQACMLAPQNMMIGFSGGEPLLYKEQLFALLEKVHTVRPDLKFHVLTNAQHFEEDDVERLRQTAFKSVLWGVPLYASDPSTHDSIVGKIGAFEQLVTSLPIMARAGLQIELRSVLLKQNYHEFEQLSRFISSKLPFVSVWAIMQLERIGFAKNRWFEQFVDHSENSEPLMAAVSVAKSVGLDISLYNIPYCTVPQKLRGFLSQSISDWKRSFPADCEKCSVKSICTGFFEWHSTLEDYKYGGVI
ncbi:MAG: His-Xaa-Ser system radical SAM maturase HxsC [Robiginitomaculum sp.]|nr:MAG: His-Xaa-Ser system radical SAM maturase HxsC [Robiginitomaculum sp.]